MIEFGRTLREAREAKGLTIKQIAESTHLMSSIVEDLENEQFTRIVAPIYGRGFVKLYCEAVGLDAKPMVAEFMEIFNGNREATIKERKPATKAPPPPPPPPVEEEPEVAEEEPIPAPLPSKAPQPRMAAEPRHEPDLFFNPPPQPEPPAEEETPPAPDVEPQQEFRLSSDPVLSSKATREPEPIQPQAPMFHNNNPLSSGDGSRYGTPYREDSRPKGPGIGIPPAVWRIAIVAVVVLVLGWGALVGLKALYKMLTTAPQATAPQTTTEEVVETAPTREEAKEAKETKTKPEAKAEKVAASKKASVKRTPIKVPSLYID